MIHENPQDFGSTLQSDFVELQIISVFIMEKRYDMFVKQNSIG
jgi:hypothetical protein